MHPAGTFRNLSGVCNNNYKMNLGLKFLIILQFAHFLLLGQNKVRIPAWSFQDDHTTIVGLGVGLATPNKTSR